MELRHRPRAVRAPAFGRSILLWATGALVVGTLASTPLTATGPTRAVGLLSSADALEVAGSDGTRIEVALDGGARFSRAAALADGWIAAGVRNDEALLLLRAHDAAGDEPERMVVPAAGGALVATPVPIVADGRLLGMVWLAGDTPRGLGVRYAEWLGDRWGASETVSAPGPGSQLAVTATVLQDGTVLAVWSAFDGSDDEILWSLRSEGSWTPAARIADDNAVPDITPAVALDGGRPLAVWSRFDGRSYSLVASRFASGSWSEPTPISSTGALFPKLRSSSEGMLLSYRDVPAGGWTVVRLDRQLGAAARVTVETRGGDEPVILDADRETVRVIPGPGRAEVTLRWKR